MTLRIYRFRQAVGLIYILLYMVIFAYAFMLRDYQPAEISSTFALTVMLWFVLSLAVKVSMLMNRIIELLNLFALLAFMSIGITYIPHPAHYSSIEDFCYYLYFYGGPACDFFDFLYEATPKREQAGRP